MAAGAAGAGLAAAEAAESRPKALGAEETKLRAAEAAEPRLGSLGSEGKTPGVKGIAVDAAVVGPTAANAGEAMVEATDAAEAREEAERSPARGGRAAWRADDTTADEFDEEAAGRAAGRTGEGAEPASRGGAGEEVER